MVDQNNGFLFKNQNQALGNNFLRRDQNNQTSTNLNQGANSSNLPVDDPFHSFDVPLTLSLLVSNSLYPDIYSPVGTLILPFVRKLIPHGYFIVIGLELLSLMLVKWLSTSSARYGSLPGSHQQAYPDINAVNQIFTHPQAQSVSQPQTSQQGRAPQGQDDSRIWLFGSPQEDRTLTQEIFQTPLVPTEGLTINLALSTPFSSINSRTGATFNLKLKAIDKAPGYLIPVILVVLYVILGPYFKEKIARGEE